MIELSKISNIFSQVEEFDDKGFDLNVYRVLSKKSQSEYSFFNSHSEILTEKWLAKYIKCSKINKSLFVSATGSYENFGFNIPKFSLFDPMSMILFIPKIILRLLNNRLNLADIFFIQANPHLRTNAFFNKNCFIQ